VSGSAWGTLKVAEKPEGKDGPPQNKPNPDVINNQKCIVLYRLITGVRHGFQIMSGNVCIEKDNEEEKRDFKYLRR
jgi:hypothetical protein